VGPMNSGSAIEPLKVYSIAKNGQNHYVDQESAQLAALAMAQARDGALVDGSLFKQQMTLNSRHLLELSENPADLSSERKLNATTNKFNLTHGNAQNKSNEMDFVLINGTWHVIDLSICQKMMSNQTSHDIYYNLTHVNRLV
jgi:hypothetical protein